MTRRDYRMPRMIDRLGAALCVVLMAGVAGEAQSQPGAVPMHVNSGAPASPLAQSHIYPSGSGATPTESGNLLFVPAQMGDRVHYLGPWTHQGVQSYSPRTGLGLTLQTSSAGHYGYQALVVTVVSSQPAKSDRRIQVEFHAGRFRDDGRSIVVTAPLKLAGGETTATTSVLVPQLRHWEQVGWRTEVDGQPDDDLSVPHVYAGHHPASFGLHILLATPNVPQVELENAFQVLGNGTAMVSVQKHEELPLEWLGYTTMDVVVLTAGDLPRLAQAEPKRHDALLRWVKSGGNLWLLECGRLWQEAPGAERALKLRTSSTGGAPEPNARSADAAMAARGWKYVPIRDRATEPLEGALVLSGYEIVKADQEPARGRQGRGTVSSALAGFAGRVAQLAQSQTSQPYFALRPYGLGTVTAFRDNFSTSPQMGDTISVLQQSLLGPRIMWPSRHGLKPDSAASEFNNWLIPGVGVAPVGQFQFLISLFVLAIGPLNYWWLKRQRKLPMLLVTVPLAAAAVTIVLVTYGVLADGLGVRMRARTLTVLDQVAGDAVSWSRLSYYAGVQPRGGLTFSRATAVYPILPGWALDRYGDVSTGERAVAWSDKQRLSEGWLAPRTPTQYLTVSSRPTEKRLDIRPAAGGLQIGNRLGVTVKHLLIQDRDGQVYWCENLPPDQRLEVQPTTRVKASTALRRVFTDNYPEYPPGAEEPAYGSLYYETMLSQNILDTQLEAMYSPVVEAWTNGSYIAVTERGVEIEYGVDSVAEESSFHVVRGVWQP